MKNLTQKMTVLCGMVVFGVMDIFAQQQGVSAINQATSGLKAYITPIVNLFYVICGIMAFVGAFKVYSKWSSGDPDTTKFAASWFGALIFAVLVATIVKAFFSV